MDQRKNNATQFAGIEGTRQAVYLGRFPRNLHQGATGAHAINTFTFWITLEQLMQRWQTHEVETVFEAIRAGLPVHEKARDFGISGGMEQLSPGEAAERYYFGGEYGVEPLGGIRFKLQELTEFEQTHHNPWQPITTTPTKRRKLDPEKAIIGWKVIAAEIGLQSQAKDCGRNCKRHCKKYGIQIEHTSSNKPWTTLEEIARSRN